MKYVVPFAKQPTAVFPAATKYVASNTKVEIISWKGTCIVHEQFTAKETNENKQQHPGIVIIAHPECPPDVIQACLLYTSPSPRD